MECWGAGVGSVQGQSRGGTALDMDRETLEPQGRGPLTNVHSELGEKILGTTGFAAMEEGLISRSGRNLRVPLHF